MTDELRQFQAVKNTVSGERGYIAALNNDGTAEFASDHRCKHETVNLSDLQPASIKKTYGVEGNNFID